MTQNQTKQVYTYNDILALLRTRHMELKGMGDSFKSLQQEIVALEKRAPYDPQAAARVRKVHALLKGELKTLPEEMKQQAERYVRELKRLQALINSAFPQPAAVLRKPSAPVSPIATVTPTQSIATKSIKPIGIKKKMGLV